jgi:DNA-binding response OmpR family regulator
MNHILLIEPDVKLAAVYAAGLRAKNYSVTTTTTAQDAVTAADAQRPDAVLLELQLVAHSGIEFLYEFRSYDDWRTVPVIIHSHVPPAIFEASRKLLYERLGVREYHYKPHTTLRNLLSSVERCTIMALT